MSSTPAGNPDGPYFLEQALQSRSLNENTEWQLSPAIFKEIVRTLDFKPQVDIFAPYLNYQVENYISWFPDPKASIISASGIHSVQTALVKYLVQHWQKYEATKQWDHDYVVLADPVLVPFDAANAARLPTSATKQQKVIDFVVKQTKQYTHYYQR